MGCCGNKFPKLWRLLWNWERGRDRQSFELHVRKNLETLKRLLGTWKLEVILVKTQMEKENMFFETRGRAVLFIMW